MKVDDLIKELEKIEEEYGNIEVKVQYRDDGGPYAGCDEPEIYVKDEDNEKKVTL